MTERTLRSIVGKLRRDKKTFEQSIPSEYKTLKTLLTEIDPGVKLASGDYYRIKRADVERLSKDLPWFLHNLVRLPMVFTYKKVGEMATFKLITPSKWTMRALGYLLEGDLTKTLFEIQPSTMSKLINKYKSLIIVVLSIDI